MTDIRSNWTQIGDDLNSLAMKLRLHFEQAASDETAAARDALQELRGALDNTFEAVGKAAKDPAIRDDVKRVGSSLGEAISKTFAEVGSGLSKPFQRSAD